MTQLGIGWTALGAGVGGLPAIAAVSPKPMALRRVGEAAESGERVAAAGDVQSVRGATRGLTTREPGLYGLLDEVRLAARHDVVALLVGETGCGKTHLARLIHELSPRQAEPFCTVACGALPPELIASELFGYVRGAFTGADRDREGKFAAAGRGTLLLDEIDVLPVEQQAKLLRVIETGEYEPVGSNETRRHGARLIVASNRDLDELSRRGEFRRDLYFRLDILKLCLTPLRERTADIELLAREFVAAQRLQHGTEVEDISPECLAALARYDWPGNVRELENVIRRAVLYCRGSVLMPQDLPSVICGASGARVATVSPAARSAVADEGTLESRLEAHERQVIVETLARHGGKRGVTAGVLGISRVTLYNKMRKFGLLG